MCRQSYSRHIKYLFKYTVNVIKLDIFYDCKTYSKDKREVKISKITKGDVDHNVCFNYG